MLREARQTLQVQAYSFTSESIAQALVAAHQRGVHVEVILDKSQQVERHSMAPRLVQAGIPIQIDSAHAIAHNKVMVIDGETVVTGSFNFTQGAEERNAENLLIIHDRVLASQYAKNWHLHRAHSRLYTAVASRQGQAIGTW